MVALTNERNTNLQHQVQDAAELPVELRVLTLNVWGLKWISSDRVARLRAIAQVLSGARPAHNLPELYTRIISWDVVCLQEVWIPSEAEMLALAARQGGLAYWRHFRSGALGSGLLICSRHPIVESCMRPYRLNGHPLKVWEGDWFVGKGLAIVTLDLPGGRRIEVMNTHLYAPGRDHRLAQVWELARWVRDARDKGRSVVLCGDLNSKPDSTELNLLRQLTDLIDSWPAVATTGKHDTPLAALQAGVTSNSPLGTYTSPQKSGLGKKLDYILVSPEFSSVYRETAFSGQIESGHSFSDHFGVSSVVQIGSLPQSMRMPSCPTGELQELLQSLDFSLDRSRTETTCLLTLLAVCLGLSVASPIAASFQPLRYLNWIWPLLSSAAGILGTLGLTAGFVGGRWEANAIESIKQEVQEWLQQEQRVKARQ